jgi:hypothetical protein
MSNAPGRSTPAARCALRLTPCGRSPPVLASPRFGERFAPLIVRAIRSLRLRRRRAPGPVQSHPARVGRYRSPGQSGCPSLLTGVTTTPRRAHGFTVRIEVRAEREPGIARLPGAGTPTELPGVVLCLARSFPERQRVRRSVPALAVRVSLAFDPRPASLGTRQAPLRWPLGSPPSARAAGWYTLDVASRSRPTGALEGASETRSVSRIVGRSWNAGRSECR